MKTLQELLPIELSDSNGQAQTRKHENVLEIRKASECTEFLAFPALAPVQQFQTVDKYKCPSFLTFLKAHSSEIQRSLA